MRDCLLLRQEWTDDNCITEQARLEQFYSANPIVTLVPGGRSHKCEEGRRFVECERPVLESHDRDKASCGSGKCLSKAIAVGDSSFHAWASMSQSSSTSQGCSASDRCCVHMSAAQPHSQLTKWAAGGWSKATLITEHLNKQRCILVSFQLAADAAWWRMGLLCLQFILWRYLCITGKNKSGLKEKKAEGQETGNLTEQIDTDLIRFCCLHYIWKFILQGTQKQTPL